MKEENSVKVFNPEEAVYSLLPKAGLMETGLLALRFKTEADISALEKSIAEIRRDIALPEGTNGDYIIAKVLLNEVSLKAAETRVEVLVSAGAVAELCSKLALDEQYFKLLLNTYASPASAKTFIKKWGELSASFEGDIDFNSKEASKIVDAMLEEASSLEALSPKISEENSEFLKELVKEKKLSQSTSSALGDYYKQPCARPIKPVFEAALKEISQANADFAAAYEFAARVLLMRLTASEAAQAAVLAKEIKYNILPEDLQIISLKYLKLKTPKEISDTIEGVLKRLPYADYPEENISLAFRIMSDASGETFSAAEKEASYQRGKKIFLRELFTNKHFNGYEDELTAIFYGKTTKEGVEDTFLSILRNLPHNKDVYENADIAVKVLLGKLPEADAEAQALFRKENKVLYSAGSLESEAVESYLGTKDRAEVLSFFRERLSKYSFWKSDDAKHGYALSLLVGELNGNITPFAAALALDMLQEDWPEQSVETITKALPAHTNFTKESILSAYGKFYQVSSDHADAAKRVANMLQ